MNEELRQKIISFAKKHYMSSDHTKSHHGWDHVLRVKNLSLKIGMKEGANLEVLEIAAYLHDIMRQKEMQENYSFCHAIKGAEVAEEFLTSIGYDKTDEVVHCIRTHRFVDNNIPETKEAKILFDADKLDITGAVGIARCYSHSGGKGSDIHAEVSDDYQPQGNERYTNKHTPVHEYKFKLRKIKEILLTESAKEIAKNRHEFMKEFFERLEKEIKGEL